MGHQHGNLSKLAEKTGVPYSTIRAWVKSRPDLINYIQELEFALAGEQCARHNVYTKYKELSSMFDTIHNMTSQENRP